jgi:GT2 family glycosyltransferase
LLYGNQVYDISNLAVVIPTLKREQVLLDTICYLLNLEPEPVEIIVVDQTERHQFNTEKALDLLQNSGKLRWIRLLQPSIPHAMNVGLIEARSDIVLFLDDDIIPDRGLIEAHLLAHEQGYNIVAGQVLQPGEEPTPDNSLGEFRFCSNRRQLVDNVMGCNFSVKKKLAIGLGAFDENFVHVAYRFETEFADRAFTAGEKILFEPSASICHLRARSGGTRSFGEHLRTMKPSHSVGAYYYLMRSGRVRHRVIKIIGRAFRAVRTRHHLLNPWWVPVTVVAEFLGFIWAAFLFLKGPKYIKSALSDSNVS